MLCNWVILLQETLGVMTKFFTFIPLGIWVWQLHLATNIQNNSLLIIACYHKLLPNSQNAKFPRLSRPLIDLCHIPDQHLNFNFGMEPGYNGHRTRPHQRLCDWPSKVSSKATKLWKWMDILIFYLLLEL